MGFRDGDAPKGRRGSVPRACSRHRHRDLLHNIGSYEAIVESGGPALMETAGRSLLKDIVEERCDEQGLDSSDLETQLVSRQQVLFRSLICWGWHDSLHAYHHIHAADMHDSLVFISAREACG